MYYGEGKRQCIGCEPLTVFVAVDASVHKDMKERCQLPVKARCLFLNALLYRKFKAAI